MRRGLEREVYGLPDVRVWGRAVHLEKFIAPGSIVKSSWPGGVFLCAPTHLGPINTCTGRGSKASVRDGHMDTGCCGLDGKTEFSLLLSHRADESV